MIQNLFTGNGCSTKHPLNTCCLEFQAYIYTYTYFMSCIYEYKISMKLSQFPGDGKVPCFPFKSSSFFAAKTQVLKAQLDLAKEFQRHQRVFLVGRRGGLNLAICGGFFVFFWGSKMFFLEKVRDNCFFWMHFFEQKRNLENIFLQNIFEQLNKKNNNYLEHQRGSK